MNGLIHNKDNNSSSWPGLHGRLATKVNSSRYHPLAHGWQTSSGRRQPQATWRTGWGSLCSAEIKTLDAGHTYQLLEIPASLSIPSFTEQPPGFALNVSYGPKKKAFLKPAARQLDANERSGCLAGGVVRKIPEGWSEEARQGYGAEEQEEARTSPLQASERIFRTECCPQHTRL